MSTMESDRLGSQDWDPALWSIAAALEHPTIELNQT